MREVENLELSSTDFVALFFQRPQVILPQDNLVQAQHLNPQVEHL